jgi:hypothetical protein
MVRLECRPGKAIVRLSWINSVPPAKFWDNSSIRSSPLPLKSLSIQRSLTVLAHYQMLGHTQKHTECSTVDSDKAFKEPVHGLPTFLVTGEQKRYPFFARGIVAFRVSVSAAQPFKVRVTFIRKLQFTHVIKRERERERETENEVPNNNLNMYHIICRSL